MHIQEVTLLTSTEYNRLKHLISDLECTWWLKDEGKYKEPYSVSFLDAEITDVPARESERYVRPALRLTDIQTHTPGAKITVFAYTWTVLETVQDVSLVLCDQIVTRRPFDKNGHAWEESDIKKWLEVWLKKRNTTADNRRHKQYKCMNDIGLKYLNSEFMRYWLTPMSLILPIAIVMCYCAWSIQDVFTPPTWLFIVMNGLAGGIAVINILITAFILLSPHPDTGLRSLLNTLFLIAVLVLCWNMETLLSLTSLTSAIAISGINREYLGKIKYYS